MKMALLIAFALLSRPGHAEGYEPQLLNPATIKRLQALEPLRRLQASSRRKPPQADRSSRPLALRSRNAAERDLAARRLVVEHGGSDPVEALKRGARQENAYQAGLAAKRLLELDLEAGTEAFKALALRPVQDHNSCLYQLTACHRLVELGHLEYIGVAAWLARKPGPNCPANGSLSVWTGLQFQDSPQWWTWWEGIQKGISVKDDLVLDPELIAVRQELHRESWYTKFAAQPGFEKFFFSKDQHWGLGGALIYQGWKGVELSPAEKLMMYRWYVTGPNVRLRAEGLNRLWKAGVRICPPGLPEEMDFHGIVVKLKDEASIEAFRGHAVLTPDPANRKAGPDAAENGWALHYLCLLGDPEVPRLAASLLGTNNAFTRYEAAAALAHFGKLRQAKAALARIPALEKKNGGNGYYTRLSVDLLKAIDDGTFKPLQARRCP